MESVFRNVLNCQGQEEEVFVNVTTRETFLNDIRLARQKGTRIFHTQEGYYYATSESNVDQLYAVDLCGCFCEGFKHRGHCSHNAALLHYIVVGQQVSDENT